GDMVNTFNGFMDFCAITLPIDDGDFYVCGPLAFMKFVKTRLIAMGVSDHRIHYEVFGPHAEL
ncbi:NO-inducible flavohemoprotein, partial [Pseudoalteromonas sp. MM17-2]|nr:NO-inducible flavohemoprotein [Pseudoalteromonas sp. MM17-2]